MMRRDRAATRNKCVEIEKPTESETAGELSRTWTRPGALFGRAWVSIEPLSGREYWEAERQDSAISHKVTGLWNDFSSVTADMRLKYETRYFNLVEPPRNVGEAGALAEVMVEEVKG
ncbi:MAG TPA: head-tail adaptor protein [Thermoguttaceae bacterium]|nr:head-tail adaptor protein [Thermoguttaceae bacterium]